VKEYWPERKTVCGHPTLSPLVRFLFGQGAGIAIDRACGIPFICGLLLDLTFGEATPAYLRQNPYVRNYYRNMV